MKNKDDILALDENYTQAFGEKWFDNYIRSMSHQDGIEDVGCDEARQRLREHVLTELEREGKTRFSRWNELTEQEKIDSLKAVIESERSIHVGRKSSPVLNPLNDDTGLIMGSTSRNGQVINLNRDLINKGTASENVNIVYHESKHVDQIDQVTEMKVKNHVGGREKESLIVTELGLDEKNYQENYQSLLIEAEARAAGRNGQAALDKVLSARKESQMNDALRDKINAELSIREKNLNQLNRTAHNVLREKGINSPEYTKAAMDYQKANEEYMSYKRDVNRHIQESYIERRNTERLGGGGNKEGSEEVILARDAKNADEALKKHGINSEAYRSACETEKRHQEEFSKSRQAFEKHESALIQSIKEEKGHL